jgi:ketosteroid isomerase-like protein
MARKLESFPAAYRTCANEGCRRRRTRSGCHSVPQGIDRWLFAGFRWAGGLDSPAHSKPQVPGSSPGGGARSSGTRGVGGVPGRCGTRLDRGSQVQSQVGRFAGRVVGAAVRLVHPSGPVAWASSSADTGQAMSHENVEVVRKACEAWSRGDLDAVFEINHPEVEWDTTHFDGWPENQVYRGREEVSRFLSEWLASWDSYEAGVDGVFDAGDRVVAFWWQRMTGQGSGVPVELDSAQIWTVRDGRVIRIDNYTHRAEALEAAGLSESTMSRGNLEVVQALHQLRPADLASGRRDPIDFFDPNVEWLPAAQSLLAGDTYHGHEGVRRFWTELLSTWDEYLVEPTEFVDLGDQVAVIMRIRARSGRGIEVNETWSGLYTLRQGRIVRFQGFTNRDGALEAVGLPE